MLDNNDNKVNKILSLAANYKRKNSCASWGEILDTQSASPSKTVSDVFKEQQFSSKECTRMLPKLSKLFDDQDNIEGMILMIDAGELASIDDDCKDEIIARVEQSKKDKH